jgi:hypothetical protein
MFRANSCSSSRESIVSIQHLLRVTLCRWPSSMQVGKELTDVHTRRSEWHIADGLIPFILLMMSTRFFETWRELKQTYRKKKCVKLVIYKNYTDMAARSTEYKMKENGVYGFKNVKFETSYTFTWSKKLNYFPLLFSSITNYVYSIKKQSSLVSITIDQCLLLSITIARSHTKIRNQSTNNVLRSSIKAPIIFVQL